jgi:hypothetical protein
MIGSAAPGTQFLFKAGPSAGSWSETWTLGDTPAHSANGTAQAPIVIGRYGTGLALFDEVGVHPYCIVAMKPAYPVNYLILDHLECTHATSQGINFRTAQGFNPQNNLQGIVIRSLYVHNTGPGCSNTNGPCVGNDPGGYQNQLNFEDDAGYPHNVQILYNTVKWCGGHNCLQVHYDTGSPRVMGNVVGPGCVHNCLDLKNVGNFANGNQARVIGNTVTCGVSLGLCGVPGKPASAFYTQNNAPGPSGINNEQIEFEDNTGIDVSTGFNQTANATGCGPAGCPIVSRYYNNTVYCATKAWGTFGLFAGSNGGSYGLSTLDAENDIFDGCGQASISVDPGYAASNPQAGSVTIEDYNDIGGSQGSPGFRFGGWSKGAHDVTNVDPMYVDRKINLHLAPGSPMRGAGAPNIHPDIGAY